MTKKDNFNNNDPISKVVDFIRKSWRFNKCFKEGGLYKELTKKMNIWD